MIVYTTAGAGELLGLKPRTLRWYHKQYGYGRKQGRDILFDDTDIERIREHSEAGPGPTGNSRK